MSKDWSISGVDLHLSLTAGGGRRAALERALRHAIQSGRLVPGTRLPSTRALAAELGLSRGTVSAAYDQLVAEGYLLARTGSGTTVAALPPTRHVPSPRPAAEALPRYDLRPGSPDVTTFPVSAWLRATRSAMSRAPASVYDYADPQGRPELRAALAGYLGRTRGVATNPDQIVITSGYVQALGLLAEVLRVTGTTAVAMEDPGLPFHRAVVRRTGLAVVPLPVDRRGPRVELLSTTDLRNVGAVVVTPAHQYPTGVTMPPDRRHALAEWARSTGSLIIEDDYDGEFRYDRQPVGALQGMAPEHVVYAGTASKTLGPALRLAWLALPQRLVGPLVEAKRFHDVHTEVIGQLALAELINTHGYDRHVRSARRRYRRRRDLLLERIGPYVGARLVVDGIAAGLHVMLRLSPNGPGEQEIIDRAAANGLALDGLGRHWHEPGGHPQGVIVGYGTPTEHAYPAALDVLARVLSGAGFFGGG